MVENFHEQIPEKINVLNDYDNWKSIALTYKMTTNNII